MRQLETRAPAQPWLCVGKVGHTRLRPVRHRFSYPVFYLRLPLRQLGEQGFGLRWLSRNAFNLLSFRDRDYGDGQRPLLAWLDGLLRAHGVHDADGEVWLQTMPRVLGFAFNPVSFYFCHRADGSLRAVLCDVHNTFGERHYYLLEGEPEIANGQELAARKIFHVSPFNRVEGRYRFRFVRTLRQHQGRPAEVTVASIDYDDAAGPLMHTSVSGCALPLTDRHVLGAFLQMPFLTLMVVLRIHWQALLLWWRRVPFYRKPLPPTEEVSR